jgi:DNA-binding transcriptional LysR family regulator
MELRHLRYFVAVAEAGAFSRAATRLRITQPALWRQVHDLEMELGVRLFERAGRRIRLTSAGEGLLRRSRDLLDGVDQLAEHAHAMRSGEVGTLRVGASPQIIQSVLPPVLVTGTPPGGIPRVEHAANEGVALACGGARDGLSSRHDSREYPDPKKVRAQPRPRSVVSVNGARRGARSVGSKRRNRCAS